MGKLSKKIKKKNLGFGKLKSIRAVVKQCLQTKENSTIPILEVIEVMKSRKGKILFLLHAHLPYIHHPDFENFMEERWFLRH